MRNVTLICTEHGENGACNVDGLYYIIKKISPEIIFEEIPPSFFDAYYKYKNRNNLESIAINKYLESHQIKHIPVDYYDIPNSFDADNRDMYGRIEAVSPKYRRLVDAHVSNVNRFGFKYLNSVNCNNLWNDIYSETEDTLQYLNNEKYIIIYKLWNNIMEKRENEMINNIYSYSKEHRFDRGLFLIGAAHRKSIINKIQKYSGTELVNWNINKYDNIF